MLPCLWLLVLPLAQTSPGGAYHGWKPDVDYRFAWVQDRQKVGETNLRWTALKAGDSKPAAAWRIDSRRTFDRSGISQRATSHTLCDSKGLVCQYEESLDITANVGKKSQQQTSIETRDGKARVTYKQPGKAAPPMETALPEGARIWASQAIEHWILFLAEASFAGGTLEQKLYYPDFGRVLNVTFKKIGEEKVRVGTGDLAATKYSFEAAKDDLQGNVWLDTASRLIQIEFVNTLKRELTLRVTLAEESPAAAPAPTAK